MYRPLLGLLLLFNSTSLLEALDEDALRTALRGGIHDFLKTGNQTEELKEVLQSLQFPGLFSREPQVNPIIGSAACMACDVILEAAIKLRTVFGIDKYFARNFLEQVCGWLNLEPMDVCHGFLEVNFDTLLYIIDHKPDLTSFRICSIVMQSFGCKDYLRKDWVIPVPEKNTSLHMHKKPDFGLLKIIHLTDIHYDLNYTIGSNAVCDEPMCCRPGSKPDKPENAAGRWGNYECDISEEIIDHSLNHIRSKHNDLKYIYFTGDIVDHKLWGTSRPRNTKVIDAVLDKVRNHFGNIPFFPILGNHDPHPLNAYSPDAVKNTSVSSQWIFKEVAEKWKIWLPDDTQETILKGGYYTVLVKPGFRIIGLNSAVCFITNWWLIYDDYDPYGQLKWLVDVLHKAEENREIVHILSHVPSGDFTCFYNWGREYAKIIKRFSKTIAAQFNGHTHRQDVVLHYDSEDLSNPVHIAFNGGSLTTWFGVNPNYIVYYVDSDSYEVFDYESWTYNITDANLTPDKEPNWFKLYSFMDAYNVYGLKPKTLNDLIKSMPLDRSLAEKYNRFRFRDSDYSIKEGCDDNCYKENLCTMVTTYYGDVGHCNILKNMWGEN